VSDRTLGVGDAETTSKILIRDGMTVRDSLKLPPDPALKRSSGELDGDRKSISPAIEILLQLLPKQSKQRAVAGNDRTSVVSTQRGELGVQHAPFSEFQEDEMVVGCGCHKRPERALDPGDRQRVQRTQPSGRASERVGER
jgi:hypothetical protein